MKGAMVVDIAKSILDSGEEDCQELIKRTYHSDMISPLLNMQSINVILSSTQVLKSKQ